mmetsp:Transcript_33941/g.97753  ORF Transcript_33941/g.97753 Transcript_33941/m.97753 type:complete len:331 (+) Transcript_33941:1539-2531(+)
MHQGACGVLLRDIGGALQELRQLRHNTQPHKALAVLHVADCEVPDGVRGFLGGPGLGAKEVGQRLERVVLLEFVLVRRALVAEIPETSRRQLLLGRRARAQEPHQLRHNPGIDHPVRDVDVPLAHRGVGEEEYQLERVLTCDRILEQVAQGRGEVRARNLHGQLLVAFQLLLQLPHSPGLASLDALHKVAVGSRHRAPGVAARRGSSGSPLRGRRRRRGGRGRRCGQVDAEALPGQVPENFQLVGRQHSLRLAGIASRLGQQHLRPTRGPRREVDPLALRQGIPPVALGDERGAHREVKVLEDRPALHHGEPRLPLDALGVGEALQPLER